MKGKVKNLRKAAQRILRAIKNEERIILYGDADLDGIGSVIILKETIEKLGGKISAFYFPEREKEGYGITEEALGVLKKNAPALFIALDCGISNFEEVKKANKLGFEVIIIDHHQVLDKLPEASIIVDPKQETDKYPFKEMACVGVSYKLAEAIFTEDKENYPKNKRFLKEFLEIVALGTIADQVPLICENEKFVKEGLGALNHTSRPGLQVLIELTGFKDGGVQEIQQKITSRLKSSENRGNLNNIFIFLTEKSIAKTEKMALNLIKESRRKKDRTDEIYSEVEKKVKDSDFFVFQGGKEWPLILLGGVASRICRKFRKPVFLYRIQGKENQGTVRNPGDINGVEAMAHCKELLETYGGHAKASGFRVKNKNLKKFEKCLSEYFRKRINSKEND